MNWNRGRPEREWEAAQEEQDRQKRKAQEKFVNDEWNGADERWDAPWPDEYGEEVGSRDERRPGSKEGRRSAVGCGSRADQDGGLPTSPPGDGDGGETLSVGARESIAAIVRAAVPDVRFCMVSIARPFPGFKSVVIIGMAPASAA